MDTLKQLFPHAFKSTETNPLVIAIIIYVVIGVVGGAVVGILSIIPFVGILFSLLGTVVGLYSLIGIVLSVLVFTKVIKD